MSKASESKRLRDLSPPLPDHRLETDEATCTCIELDNYTRRICLYHLFAMSFREQREWSVVVRKRGPLPFIEQPMFE